MPPKVDFADAYQLLASVLRVPADGVPSLSKVFQTKRLHRKQPLVQIGEPCRLIAFVANGTLRSFFHDERGIEHTMQFAIRGQFITDFVSLTSGQAGQLFIEALEECDLLVLHQSAFDTLAHSTASYHNLLVTQLTHWYTEMSLRLMDMMSLTVEQRYMKFVDQHPELATHVPQHMIASYLGITPESVSRIRRRAAHHDGHNKQQNHNND